MGKKKTNKKKGDGVNQQVEHDESKTVSEEPCRATEGVADADSVDGAVVVEALHGKDSRDERIDVQADVNIEDVLEARQPPPRDEEFSVVEDEILKSAAVDAAAESSGANDASVALFDEGGCGSRDRLDADTLEAVIATYEKQILGDDQAQSGRVPSPIPLPAAAAVPATSSYVPKDRERYGNPLCAVVCGTPAAGKSTFALHLSILASHDIDETHRKAFTPLVHKQVIAAARGLIR